MSVLSKGNLFPAELVPEFLNMVNGKSSLAKMSGAKPLAFNGMKEFTFSLDSEIDVVAENGAKGNGGVSVTPVTIVPIKVEYGARVSDEFDYASEEVRLDYLRAFAEGWSAKVARGIDIMAMHGVNPRTGSASSVIGTNNLDSKVTNSVTYGTGTPDEDVEAAIALVQDADFDVTGLIMGNTLKGALAAMKNSTNDRLYPDLAWGNAPSSINGLPVDVNSTVQFNSNTARAYVGNFRDYFRWGIAKELPIEIIRYGNPDNDASAGDLKGHNQIYLRGEAFIGWGILNADAFAKITV